MERTFPTTSLQSLHKNWWQPVARSLTLSSSAIQVVIPQSPNPRLLFSSSTATSRLCCVRSVRRGLRSVRGRANPPISGRLLYLLEFGRGSVVMATTGSSPAPGAPQSLEEETKIAATLETGSSRSGLIGLEAVFFDLDDTLVLTHAADTLAHKAVQALAQRRIPHVNGDEMLKVFIAKFDVQPWDVTHQVEVTEWRAWLWGEALKSQGVEDMGLARDMQRCFDEERLLSFQWAPGVAVVFHFENHLSFLRSFYTQRSGADDVSGVVMMVRRLHTQGIKVGIITNGHFSVQRTKLKACKADQFFDMILVGGEEPNQKPHKDIFLKACKLAGCKPENSIMVGDNLKTDIQGAMNAGFLATVWVNVHNLEWPSAGGPMPHHIIPNIGELLGLLKELGALSEDPSKTSTT